MSDQWTQAEVASLRRQDPGADGVKRRQWTEDDVDALPPGEHDYFERKSGQLFGDQGILLGTLSKAVSAFANSGGGHIVLGVGDDGQPDGVPRMRGHTTTRDWLAQQIPHLVAYPLGDFRVHVVQRAAVSRIPSDRDVIVVDVGDSALAPHQCARGASGTSKYMYYYRQAGRSEPAPHFHLELLRQRLISAVLTADLTAVKVWRGMQLDGGVLTANLTEFVVTNTSRLSARHWDVQLVDVVGCPRDRHTDYRFHPRGYPRGLAEGADGPRGGLDDVILPLGTADVSRHFGVLFRPVEPTREAIKADVERMLLRVQLGFRVVTESFVSEVQFAPLSGRVDSELLVKNVLIWLTGQDA
jgi:hypothetical protein